MADLPDNPPNPDARVVSKKKHTVVRPASMRNDDAEDRRDQGRDEATEKT